jgi:hypothetical protein
MAGLDPAIHVFLLRIPESKVWMAGIKPGMTEIVSIRMDQTKTGSRSHGELNR